jgi:hypothetical protein
MFEMTLHGRIQLQSQCLVTLSGFNCTNDFSQLQNNQSGDQHSYVLVSNRLTKNWENLDFCHVNAVLQLLKKYKMT